MLVVIASTSQARCAAPSMVLSGPSGDVDGLRWLRQSGRKHSTCAPQRQRRWRGPPPRAAGRTRPTPASAAAWRVGVVERRWRRPSRCAPRDRRDGAHAGAVDPGLELGGAAGEDVGGAVAVDVDGSRRVVGVGPVAERDEQVGASGGQGLEHRRVVGGVGIDVGGERDAHRARVVGARRGDEAVRLHRAAVVEADGGDVAGRRREVARRRPRRCRRRRRRARQRPTGEAVLAGHGDRHRGGGVAPDHDQRGVGLDLQDDRAGRAGIAAVAGGRRQEHQACPCHQRAPRDHERPILPETRQSQILQLKRFFTTHEPVPIGAYSVKLHLTHEGGLARMGHVWRPAERCADGDRWVAGPESLRR